MYDVLGMAVQCVITAGRESMSGAENSMKLTKCAGVRCGYGLLEYVRRVCILKF